MLVCPWPSPSKKQIIIIKSNICTNCLHCKSHSPLYLIVLFLVGCSAPWMHARLVSVLRSRSVCGVFVCFILLTDFLLCARVCLRVTGLGALQSRQSRVSTTKSSASRVSQRRNASRLTSAWAVQAGESSPSVC